MRFYLATSRNHRELAADLSRRLIERGHADAHNWHDPATYEAGFGNVEMTALNDLAGIDGCDVVVALLTMPSAGGGMYQELGYALAQVKPRLLVQARADDKSPDLFDPKEGHIFHFAGRATRVNFYRDGWSGMVDREAAMVALTDLVDAHLRAMAA